MGKVNAFVLMSKFSKAAKNKEKLRILPKL